MTESADIIRLDGSLCLDDVPEVHRHHQARIERQPPDTVDLSAITASDSSTVALLVEWQALAARGGRRITFHSPSDSLRTIARLTGVDHLLGWTSDGVHSRPATSSRQEPGELAP